MLPTMGAVNACGICYVEKSDEGFEGRLSKLKGKGGKKEEQQETPRQALEAARKGRHSSQHPGQLAGQAF